MTYIPVTKQKHFIKKKQKKKHYIKKKNHDSSSHFYIKNK